MAGTFFYTGGGRRTFQNQAMKSEETRGRYQIVTGFSLTPALRNLPVQIRERTISNLQSYFQSLLSFSKEKERQLVSWVTNSHSTRIRTAVSNSRSLCHEAEINLFQICVLKSLKLTFTRMSCQIYQLLQILSRFSCLSHGLHLQPHRKNNVTHLHFETKSSHTHV